MAEPPLAGAVQERAAVVLPGVAVRPAGADGAVGVAANAPGAPTSPTPAKTNATVIAGTAITLFPRMCMLFPFFGVHEMAWSQLRARVPRGLEARRLVAPEVGLSGLPKRPRTPQWLRQSCRPSSAWVATEG